MAVEEPRELDAALRLLDRQILDTNGRMVAKVDDLELEQRDDGRWYVTALLTGPGALGPRLRGLSARWVLDVWQRLVHTTDPGPGRIDIEQVTRISTGVELAITREQADVDGFEQWTRRRIIDALPGAGHEPE